MSAEETRAALRKAAVRLVGREGLRGATARAIATEADVNQALVFYHFDGVDGLLREAFDEGTRAMLDTYAAALAGATSIADLHAVGLSMSQAARVDGSAALLAQVIAAAHTDPEQARLLGRSLRLWHAAVGDAVRRLLAERGVVREIDVEATTAALSAATIGMIILDTLDPAPLGQTLPSVGRLAQLSDRVLRLVPAPLLRRVLDRVG
ncbi:TetR family transcriptional regulator [Nocardioides salsibiostraticola]